MTSESRTQISAVQDLLDAALRLDSDPTLDHAQWDAAAAVLDPLLTATNQGTCSAALKSGDPGQIVAAAGRALAQSVQLDFGGVRP